ncbi:MAG: hypothetical protein SFU98_10600 [Leptospiraceae bacterium]|nr:hypothetical protein [Leptospiraceae bacterium]
MKIALLILFLLHCASPQLQLYNPHLDSQIQIEKKSQACNEIREIKIWYVFYGSYILDTINAREIFPNSGQSYRIEQKATTGDLLISLFTGFFLSISRKTLVIESCQNIDKQVSGSEDYQKISELEKEISYLRRKISELQTANSIDQNKPNSSRKEEISSVLVEEKIIPKEKEMKTIIKTPTSKPNESERLANELDKSYPVLVATNANESSELEKKVLPEIKTEKNKENIKKEKIQPITKLIDFSKYRVLIIGSNDKNLSLEKKLKQAQDLKDDLLLQGIKAEFITIKSVAEKEDLDAMKKVWNFQAASIYLLEKNE